MNPAHIPRVGAGGRHMNIVLNESNESHRVPQPSLEYLKDNSDIKPTIQSSKSFINSLGYREEDKSEERRKRSNIKMPNKLPYQHITKIYDNSIESSVLSSKSGVSPRNKKPQQEPSKGISLSKYLGTKKQAKPAILIKEKLEIIADGSMPERGPKDDPSQFKLIKSRNSTVNGSFKQADVNPEKPYHTQEIMEETGESRFNAFGGMLLASQLVDTNKQEAMYPRRFNTLAQDDNNDPRTQTKKSKIEVNIDFDSFKKQPSKRTIMSKNRGSVKSINSMQAFESQRLNSKLVGEFHR
jgi:hypothetical protein